MSRFEKKVVRPIETSHVVVGRRIMRGAFAWIIKHGARIVGEAESFAEAEAVALRDAMLESLAEQKAEQAAEAAAEAAYTDRRMREGEAGCPSIDRLPGIGDADYEW